MPIIKAAEICATLSDPDKAHLPDCLNYWFLLFFHLGENFLKKILGGRICKALLLCLFLRLCLRALRLLESSFLFEEGAVHTSLYKVPPYTFDAEIRTRKIRSALSEQGGTLELIYNMKIGGAVRATRMKIWISTNSRQN